MKCARIDNKSTLCYNTCIDTETLKEIEMTKVTSNDTRVISFFNAYHDKVKTRPRLYKSQTKIVTITLPTDLIDFSNAAAGHSGFGAGARPVGIRKTVDNAEIFVSRVFSTVDHLADFLNSSECDGIEYVEGIKTRHQGKITKSISLIDVRPAKEAFYDVGHKFDLIQSLRSKFGKGTVDHSMNVLNWTEFQLRFGI